MKLNPLSTILIFSVVLLLSVTSCEIINPEEDLPAYIQIDTVIVNTNSLSVGSTTHRITDVWVSVGETFLGAFPLPATIPVLDEGNRPLIVDAGIIVDGRTEKRQIYPFYTRLLSDVDLVRTEVTTVTPELSYIPNGELEVLVLEDFDFGGGTIMGEDLDGNTATTLASTTVSANVFEGQASGSIELNNIDSLAIVGSNIPYLTLDDGTNPIFMEMHYKSESQIQVGVFAYDENFTFLAPNFFLAFKPRENWTKVYIDLKDPISSLRGNFGIEYFQIVIRVDKTNSDSKSFTYFDNLKIFRLKQ